MIAILGPTACGKTPLAVALAQSLRREGLKEGGTCGGEILSADSRQVYRRMDIGTGKDLGEYGEVPYHLIDICEPGTRYNLFQYQHDFLQAYALVRRHGAVPILCGGTGLYLEAVIKGYHLSPVPQNDDLRQRLQGKTLGELTELLASLKAQTGTTLHNTTDVDSPQRAIRAIEIETYNIENATSGLRSMPAIETLVVGVNINREERRAKITKRLRQRMNEGMADEVQRLLDEGIPAENLLYYGLEYRYVTEYVLGRITLEEMYSRLEIAIHQFAKRQMTWFRGMERRGTDIHWIDASLPMPEKVSRILELYESFQTKQ